MELSAANPECWQDAFLALPPACREVYFSPAYARVCARWERADARGVVVRHETGWMLYGCLAHGIGGSDRHDVQTAYGYGGPIFVGRWTPARRVEALERLGRHLREAGAVAEFVRCHTEWTDPDALRAAGFEVFQVRTNVECELAGEDLTAAWAPSARRNLRKAQSAGLTWRVGDTPVDWRAFEALYDQTARRLDMSPPYRFDPPYFEALARVEGVRLVLVEAGRDAVAGAVVFLGGRLAHYHLGASDFARQDLRPNDFLYFAMANLAKGAGCERIVWGGGLSNDPADTLFRFKTHFGVIRRPVYAAGRILERSAYDELCRRWQERNPGRSSKLFLRYRA